MIEKLESVTRVWVDAMEMCGWSVADFAIQCYFKGCVEPVVLAVFVKAIGPVSVDAVQRAIDKECELRGRW